ncbi:MAG: type IV pili twitching motility protein PilT, partial [Arcobacter sp.]
QRLRTYLYQLVKQNGSDLHIKSDSPVRARINEEIVSLSNESFEAENVEEIARDLAGKNFVNFMKDKELDTIYILDEEHRFRVNLFVHLHGLALVFRLIPKVIKTIEELNLPSALHKLCQLKRGLVLVTGTTGSGKSTTLASILEEININQRRHIITIEDPIEYVYKDKKCIIEQRSIGHHTHSFSSALRSSMREDPDIIVVGELRDIETAESVLQAVNTGQLVFTTLHTTDARETVDRLIAIFPNREQNRVRMNLAANIQAIVSQRLIKSLDNTLVPAVEIMFTSPRIEHLIQTQADSDIPETMAEEETSFGSITFNKALFNLVLQKHIDEETAFNYATSASDLKLLFTTSSEYQKMKEGKTTEEIHLKGEDEQKILEEELRLKETEKQEAKNRLNEDF